MALSNQVKKRIAVNRTRRDISLVKRRVIVINRRNYTHRILKWISVGEVYYKTVLITPEMLDPSYRPLRKKDRIDRVTPLHNRRPSWSRKSPQNQ